MSALITGSMIPDFQYFMLMRLNGRFSHSLPGVFLFDIPVAILVLIIFHAWVKAPLIDNLPHYFSSRLQKVKVFSFFNYAKEHLIGLLLCILIGTVSHILWDGFTHKDGPFGIHIQWLRTIVDIDGLPSLMLYRYFQYISTVVGAIVILFVFHKMPVDHCATKPRLKYWGLVAFFFALTLIVGSQFVTEYYAETVVIVISAGLSGIILASLFFRIKWNRT